MCTLWLFNIAMENGPFIDGLPSYKMGGFSMAMLNNQRVHHFNRWLVLRKAAYFPVNFQWHMLLQSHSGPVMLHHAGLFKVVGFLPGSLSTVWGKVRGYLWISMDIYGYLWSYIIRYHHISSYIIRYHQISSDIIRYHQISSDIIIYHQISSDIIRYHHISLDIIRYHQISSDIIRYHQISKNIRRECV